jgi:hypothetical protein
LTLTLTPGETYYWSLGSCQAYMNNSLSGQNICYCFDYGKRVFFPHSIVGDDGGK